jgi:hypothetical protein
VVVLPLVVGTLVKFGTKLALKLVKYHTSLVVKLSVGAEPGLELDANTSWIQVAVNVLLAVKVVNVPAAALDPPIAGGLARYVLKPAPLTVELADSVVNEPAAAVDCPTATLLMLPAVAGLIVTEPVPVGANDTLALAMLKLTVELAVSVVNAPAPPLNAVDTQLVPSDTNTAEFNDPSEQVFATLVPGPVIIPLVAVVLNVIV